MALVFERVQEEAAAGVTLARDTATLLTRIQQFLEHNSDQAIDWGAGATPAYIEENAAGNVEGFYFSRQDMSNAIGSLDWVRKLLTNQSMTGSQGDHLGNLNKLIAP